MRWKLYLMSLFLLMLIALGAYGVFHYYGTIFSKTVDGRVVRLKPVPNENESYVIAVRDLHGNIFTSIADGPRWALVKPGECAEVRFLPYPPWHVDRIGTYASSLLIKMRECRESDGPWPLELKTQKNIAPLPSEESENL